MEHVAHLVDKKILEFEEKSILNVEWEKYLSMAGQCVEVGAGLSEH